MSSKRSRKTATETAVHPLGDWQLQVRLWVERDGQAVLGEGRSDLLAAIDRLHSISAAAKSLGMSYRRAWVLVQEMNAAAAQPLVSAATGGTQGGGARLTEHGQLALRVFEQLRHSVRSSAAGMLRHVLAPKLELNETIHLAAAISLQEAVGQMLTEYALRHPLVKVRAIFGASNELAEHALAGAPCDLFISADMRPLEGLAARGLVDGAAIHAVAANRLALVGPQGGKRSIGRIHDLLSPEIGQVALADPASPLGNCSRRYLESLRLYDAMVEKAVLVDNSRGIMAAIASGAADVGLAFASDPIRSGQCEILLPISARSASVTYHAALVNRAGQAAQARELLEFCLGEVAETCIRRCGLMPPPRNKAASG